MKSYKLVNDQFIELLENNIIPWKDHLEIRLPHQNYLTMAVYQGANQLLLNGISIFKKYKSPYWLTFDQLKLLNGRVRAKEKSSKIIFYEKKVNKKGDKYTLLRYHSIFNLDQVDGIPKNPKRKRLFDLYKEKNIIDNYINGPKIIEGDENFYCPEDDFIELEDKTDFLNLSYCMIKSTGHIRRLNRICSNFEDDHPLWTLEELTCQIGQSLLMSLVGSSPSLKDSVFKNNRKTYIEAWLPILKDNPSMILNASSYARRAIKLILLGEG